MFAGACIKARSTLSLPDHKISVSAWFASVHEPILGSNNVDVDVLFARIGGFVR